MSRTQALPEYTECCRCHTHYKFYGLKPTWTYVNGLGPICEDCMKRGVTVRTESNHNHEASG